MVRAHTVILAFAFTAIGASLAHEGATGLIAERMAVMTNIGRELKAIADLLAGSELDIATLAQHAEVLHENCHKVQNMFPLGSFDHHSHALPTIWEKPEEFADKMRQPHRATEKLTAIVASGDRAMIMASFEAVRDTCRGCHETFRKPGI